MNEQLFELTKITGAQVRARHYREQAEQYKRLAETETDDKLRVQLLMLADRYSELVERLSYREA